MDEIVKDERFKHIVKDQRFKVLPKNERKVKIDKRFKNMFHDKKFKLKYTVDKRGRPTDLTTNDNLKKYYELSSEEDEDEEEDDENENEDKPGTSKEKNLGKVKKEETKTKTEVKKKEEEKDVSSEDENESESEEESSEDEEEDGKKDEEKEDEEEESEDESDDDESVNQEEEIEEIPWNELDKDTYRDEKTSRRLAVCNMDWDRIKAVDLYVIFNSFKPAQGVLKSIKIYISDYGKERLAYEKLHGPKELTEETSNVNKSNEENQETKEEERFEEESDNDSDKSEFDEDGDDFDRRKLRIYQFNRLRYYYAIIECDNEQTAEKIYSECDGMEYESSCNRVDLRFVPDDTEFDEADVRDSCTEAPDPISYKPNLFFTTALNQTRVECTWDETPHERLALTMKKYTEDELKNSDFRGILATSSEEEDNDDEEEERKEEAKKEEEKKKEKESDKPVSEEERIRRFREMLLGAEAAKSKPKKNRDADLEFDWEGGAIKEDGFDEELFDGGDKKKANSSKKFGKKHEKKRELTEEEKREQAQLSMLTMDDEDNKAHFNLDDLLVDKKHKKGRKSQHEETKTNQDDFKLNLEDPRFQAIFTSHKFNIDPSDQSFKKTKAMENLLDAKIKRMENSAANGDEESNKDDNNNSKKLISDESLLVKSIKSKTEVLKRKREENQEKLKLKSKRF